MSAPEWEQMRKAGCVPSAGALFPEPPAKAKPIAESRWDDDQRRVVKLAQRVAKMTLALDIQVQIINSPKASTGADYEQARKLLRFNVGRLGKKWFSSPAEQILKLIIHELGHEFGGHISEAYYEGLASIGAKLALCDPRDLLA
jgi:hypothetical protein